VREDWRAWLPAEKAKTYDWHTQQLEACYTMFSVTLDEALDLRRMGRTEKAHQTMRVTPALCARLVEPLAALLRSLSEHAKHYGTVPNAAPLDPLNYQGARAQRAARMSSLLSFILLSQRSQFLHKLSTLHEMVTDLGKDFSSAASRLSVFPVEDEDMQWQVVDASHFDLNTSLRETIVLFKSFLVAIPERELGGFDATYRSHLESKPSRQDSRSRILRPRRMASIAGE
jgi:hypothetical protein